MRDDHAKPPHAHREDQKFSADRQTMLAAGAGIVAAPLLAGAGSAASQRSPVGIAAFKTRAYAATGPSGGFTAMETERRARPQGCAD